MEASRAFQGDPLLRAVLARQSSDCLGAKCSDTSALLRLGQALDLCSADRVQFNGEVFRLTDVLQHHATVVRFYVSGSYGRRVTVGVPHVDLVIFVKTSVHGLPPYNVPPATTANNGGQPLLAKLHHSLAVEFAGVPDVTVSPLKQPLVTNGEDEEERHTIFVKAGNVYFRIFIAPALGKTSEEQRHGAYRHMRTLHAQYGPAALIPWHAALLERPSEIIAFESNKVQAFIRVCQLWVMLQDVPSLDAYAVEMIAYGVSRQLRLKTLQQQQQGANDSKKRGGVTAESPQGADENRHNRGQLTRVDFDLQEAFTTFLTLWASGLSHISKLHDTVSPASFLSTAADDEPYTLFYSDFFNQYRNLLKGLRATDKDLLEKAAKEKLALMQRSSTTIRDLFEPLPPVASRSAGLALGSGRRMRWISILIALMAICVALVMGAVQWELVASKSAPGVIERTAAHMYTVSERGELLFKQLRDTMNVQFGAAMVHLRRMTNAAAATADAGYIEAKRFWTNHGYPFVRQRLAQLGETVSRLKSTAVDHYLQYRDNTSSPAETSEF